jgi:hypothetical protein
MGSFETLEKIARGEESIYDSFNASGMGNDATVLAAKAKPKFQDIVHSHALAESEQHGAAFSSFVKNR